jgi:hypothetical protein
MNFPISPKAAFLRLSVDNQSRDSKLTHYQN